MYSPDLVPEVIYDARPDFVELYYKAWELAAAHIKTIPGLPVERYMDEACMADRLWIWDTCFMVNFCKYSPDFFPGIQSLDNFYAPLYDGVSSPCMIHHIDNPPLFAWIEYEYYRFTGDQSRIHRNLIEKQYLQKHYDFLENHCRFGACPKISSSYTTWQKCDDGYAWTGWPSGMDNTPRGRDAYYNILWVDALAQMALSALYIARLADVIGETSLAEEYRSKYAEKCSLLNRCYFDEQDGFYYDITIKEHDFCRVATPASFWVLLAEAAPDERASRQISRLKEPEWFGGMVPLPTVTRNDPAFAADGCYWRGGVWLPTSYMAVKSLEKYGKFDLAAEISYATLNHMAETYKNFEPQTIWECYSPTAYEPAKNHFNRYVRKDFCGWSALGPISLFIENILGFHHADAVSRKLEFHYRPQEKRFGIKNFKFGDICCDLVVENGVLNYRSNNGFTLVVNGAEFSLKAGSGSLVL